MLSLDQIMELQVNGFTWEQITAVNKTLGKAAPEPEQPAAPEPKPEQPAAPEQDVTGELSKKIDELSATVKAMQAQNVKRAEQDVPKKLSAEDVIKSFMEAS